MFALHVGLLVFSRSKEKPRNSFRVYDKDFPMTAHECYELVRPGTASLKLPEDDIQYTFEAFVMGNVSDIVRNTCKL